jgi:tRNA pseudouridine synthase 10
MRGIPQSEWICWKCGGKGCPRCNGTGKLYSESVEELIGKPFLDLASGEDISLHAAGREDIDARMLGRGRPFIIEVKKPKKRFLDLKILSKTINAHALGKVKVSNLRFANKDLIRELKKAEAAEKVYRTIVKFDRNVSDLELETLQATLNNATIHQQTPRRVLHRRADRVREKHIYMAKTKRLAPDRAELNIRCQGGLYIKELVTGDDGRTEPSVAKILQVCAKPLKLDVLNVIMKEL